MLIMKSIYQYHLSKNQVFMHCVCPMYYIVLFECITRYWIDNTCDVTVVKVDKMTFRNSDLNDTTIAVPMYMSMIYHITHSQRNVFR